MPCPDVIPSFPSPPHPQCLSVTGLTMLLFQLVIYPRLVKAMGIQGSQRWSSFVSVPLLMAMPLLSLLHNERSKLVAANLLMLFFINAAASTVGVPSPLFSRPCNRHLGTRFVFMAPRP